MTQRAATAAIAAPIFTPVLRRPPDGGGASGPARLKVEVADPDTVDVVDDGCELEVVLASIALFVAVEEDTIAVEVEAVGLAVALDVDTAAALAKTTKPGLGTCTN